MFHGFGCLRETGAAGWSTSCRLHLSIRKARERYLFPGLFRQADGAALGRSQPC
ncbi:hypothetical protein CLOLEP_00102 [[Clostridium] leptum DSM 753]|uniref:Uncharacterized protein n=1 Tax=[Clostridium] leptum DSM 753 TaxID=428125 RepID=A7VNH7_9FIRM|nr:hypothetical protein CLOLEP_00102 [[Clostridium] leptum DSM 753]